MTKRECTQCDATTTQRKAWQDSEGDVFTEGLDTDKPVWICECCKAIMPRKLRRSKQDMLIDSLLG